MKYANPWHKRGSESPAIYDRDHSKVVVKTECGRGLIIKVTNGCYDYVINGKVVTQLHGQRTPMLGRLVAVILDGAEQNGFIETRSKATYEMQL